MNAYLRFKFGLTEDAPAIKTYEEKDWARTPEWLRRRDVSLALLDALHLRWVALLRAMDAATIRSHDQAPGVGRRVSTRCWRYTPGTAGTTPRMSRACASAWGGASDG